MTASPVILALLAAPSPAPDPGSAQSTFADLMAASRRDGRPVLIEFFADWCGPCRMFEERFLPLPIVRKAIAAYHFGRLDVEGRGQDAARRFAVHALPTFLVVDSDGREVARQQGVPSTPGGFSAWLAAQAPRAASVDEMLKQIGLRPNDAGVLILAGDRLLRAGRSQEAEALLARAEASDPGNRTGLAARAGWLRGQAAARRTALAARRDFLVDYLTRYPHGENAAAALEALAELPDLPPDARKRVFGAAVDDAKTDPDHLGALVFLCLRAGALDEALTAAETLTRLRPQDGAAWDALAEVHHYRGNRALALQSSTRALGLPSEGDERRTMSENRARYERGRKEPPAAVERIAGPDSGE